MADFMDALLSPVSKEDELRALADSLRKRKRAADFYSATTIKPLQQMGQTESADVLDSAKQQGLLRESLAQRASDEMLAQAKADALAGENVLNRQNSLDVAGIRALPKATTGGKPTNIGRYIDPDGNPTMVGYVGGVPTNLASQQPIPQEVFSTMEPQTALTETSLTNNLVKFREGASKISPLISGIEQLDNMLEFYDKAGAKVDDVPGMSYIQKGPGTLGSVSRAVSDAFSGEEGAPAGDIFSAAQNILNMISVNRAGLSQTVTEIERIQKETGKDFLTNPDVFIKNLPRIKAAIKNDMALLRTTTQKRVLAEYKRNLLPEDRDVTNLQFKDIKLDGKKKGEPAGDEEPNDSWTEAQLDAYLEKNKKP